jgi:hypothetical protein
MNLDLTFWALSPDQNNRRILVHLYLQLFVGGLVYYSRYLCLCTVVSNTYCVVFLVCLSSSCVPYVASISGLSIFIAPLVTQDEDKQTKNTTQYVLDTTVHKHK